MHYPTLNMLLIIITNFRCKRNTIDVLPSYKKIQDKAESCKQVLEAMKLREQLTSCSPAYVVSLAQVNSYKNSQKN